jgi:hypothetical protein
MSNEQVLNEGGGTVVEGDGVSIDAKTRVLAERVMQWESDKSGFNSTPVWRQVLASGHKGPIVREKKDWNPYESIADAWMIVEVLRLTDEPRWIRWSQELGRATMGPVWRVGLEDEDVIQFVFNNLTPAMICDAALEAIAATSPPSTEDPAGGEKDVLPSKQDTVKQGEEGV